MTVDVRSIAGANPTRRPFASNWTASSRAARSMQSRRRQRFLEYVVNETLAGRGDRLKGYNIAVEVFDRPETFDPNVDPIVRIEAGRLRDKLREYYDADGQNDPVRIDLPKGSYAPHIEFRQAATLAPAPEADPMRQLRISTWNPCRCRLRLWTSSRSRTFRSWQATTVRAPNPAQVRGVLPVPKIGWKQIGDVGRRTSADHRGRFLGNAGPERRSVAARQAIHCRLALRQYRGRSQMGAVRRRDHRGHHHRSLPLQGPHRHRPEFHRGLQGQAD